jgi:hypothetical protein
MASIVGESYENARWHNASAADVAEIDAQIAQHQKALDDAKQLLASCQAGIAANPFYSCHNKLGRSKSNIQSDIETETVAIFELNKKRDTLVKSIDDVSRLGIQESEDDIKTTEAKGKQFLVYGGIIVGIIALIAGGIFIYKKVKK